MSKKKKGADLEQEPKPAPPPKVGTSMKGLLAGVKLAPAGAAKSAPVKTSTATKLPPKPAPKPALSAPLPGRPSDTLRGHERTAFFDAMAGVRGIGARPGSPPPRATGMKLPPAPPTPVEREGDRDARAKLASLVAGGIHFEIRREDDWQAGVRRDAPRGTLENLSQSSPGSDASLDLHGARVADVETRIAKFIRRAHQLGLRRLRIVHGKGLHSDAAGPVLGDAVIDSLTKGAAAARVIAFVTAPEAQGGSGALLVELAR